MSNERIYLSPPHQTGDELAALEHVLSSNWLAPVGPDLGIFEQNICSTTGFKYAVATSSGTAALHLGLMVLGVSEKDDILASTLTFAGSINPIIYQKANPVFIDSEQKSWNIDVDQVDNYLGKYHQKVGAILPTHLYGMPLDVVRIEAIGSKYDVPVLHDLAECLAGKIDGKRIGELAKRGALSFNGNKMITTSGGGAFVTNNKEEADRALYFATQAKSKTSEYHHEALGYNYRMSNLLAALGNSQLKSLKERLDWKQQIFKVYKSELAPLGFVFQEEWEGATSDRWLTCALFEKEKKLNIENLVTQLDKKNIEIRPFWKPMHLQPIFKGLNVVGGHVADDLYSRGICLPSGCGLTEAQQRYVIVNLKALIN